MPFETTHAEFTLTDAEDRFDIRQAHQWISRDSYWAASIPFAVFERAVRGSLTVGAYASSGDLAAMARVVTDRATFGWICDVFVGAPFRGRGLGKALTAYIRVHPDLQGLRRLHLATRDAHGLYAQFGFSPLTGADRWMEIRDPNVYRR
jgi:N-acetylglutamate synthase-like GNAT family acetyltransferase